MKVELGTKVKDKVSGFTGIVIGRTEFLFGCTRIGVQAKMVKGEVKDAQWFDEPQLTVLNAKPIVKATREQREVGGPMVSIPTRNKCK